jgi:hypothetical protein
MKLQGVMINKKHELFKHVPSLLSTVSLAVYYSIAKVKKREAFNFWITNPDTQQITELYNLHDNPLFYRVFKTLIPKIKINRKIYVPMIAPKLTL